MDNPVISVASPSPPSPGHRGFSVTAWRQQVDSRRHELAEYILSHAEPEEALRVALDTAADLADTVKRSLRATHGRVFNSLFDGVAGKTVVPATAPAAITVEPIVEQLLATITDHPGLTHRQIIDKLGQGQHTSLLALLPKLSQAGMIRREGKGTRSDRFRYFPIASPTPAPVPADPDRQD